MPHVIKNGHFARRRFRRKTDRKRRVRFETWISSFDNPKFRESVLREQTAFDIKTKQDWERIMEIIVLTTLRVKLALKAKPTWEE